MTSPDKQAVSGIAGILGAAEQLRAVRSLIDVPEAWTKGTLARDDEGNRVFTSSRDAACFCIEGAIARALGAIPYYVSDALDRAVPRTFKAGAHELRYVRFNDHPDTTHDDIMALFDRAIALAEAGQ